MSEIPGRIGSYPIERELGRGGMGIVYLGRDTRLDRPVAIKVLPTEFAADPERLARFEREARILASLNHPNIAGIYGIEESDGVRLLALQYVEGETLAQRLARGPLAVYEALDVGRQIASALEAAHEGGVIHRDLKPGNVKITPGGEVKVLDFGLARGAGAAAAGADPDPSHSPTLTYLTAGTGVILGTAAYMSPEQARGRTVDKRTDIWSFGAVLYECLTGKQAFAGETVSDTIALILQGEPNWASLPAGTPARIRELLRHCLDKDARRRLRDIGDARIELEEAAAGSSSTRAAAPAAAARARPSRATLAVAGVALAVGAAIGVAGWSALGAGGPGSRAARSVASLSIPMPPEIRVQFGTLSPDGRTLALLGQTRIADGGEEPVSRIYVRSLARYPVEPLRGTEGTLGLVFSQDGRWIAFAAPISKETTRKRLAKVPVDGSSPPVDVADWDDAWISSVWLHGGDFLVSAPEKSAFVRLPSARGRPVTETVFDAGDFAGRLFVQRALPGDRGVFVNAVSYGSRGFQIGVGLLDPGTGKTRILVPDGGNAAYSPTGHIVFARGDALLAAPFDLGRLEIRGETVALTGGLRTVNTWSHGLFDLTPDGTLFYAPGGRGGAQRRIVIVDAEGRVTPWSDERRAFEEPPGASRDGRRVACVVTNAIGIYETWISDPHRSGLRRLAAVPDADCAGPVWSPDGERIAFYRQARTEEDGVYVLRADGRDAPRRIFEPGSPQDNFGPSGWTPDGSAVLVSRFSGGKSDVLLVPVAGGEPRPLLAGPASEYDASFSPDGRWLAFASDESGKSEVYVCALRPDGAAGTAIPVSSGGGQRPRWSADGRRLVFLAEQGRLMSAAIATEPVLAASRPVLLHDLTALRASAPDFDLLPDGRLLVIQKGEEEDDISRYDVVLNWTEELRRRMEATRVARR